MTHRASIRTYLVLMNLLLLCLLFPTINLFTLHATSSFRDQQLTRTINLLENALRDRAAALARNISLSASQAVAGYDFTFLQELLRQATANDPDMENSLVMALDGRIMVSLDQDRLGHILNSEVDQEARRQATHNFPALLPHDTLIPVAFLQADSGLDPHLIEVMSPIYNGDKLWGILRCTFSRQNLETEINASRQDWGERMRNFNLFLLGLVVTFLLLGLAVVIYFTRPILASLRSLNSGVELISQGDLHHTINYQDLSSQEFIDLATSFNEMTINLRHSQEQLARYNRDLEIKVKERTNELQQAQESLLHQAHEAGMAEMAVGVLHNIGNAITPAKVGATMLIKQLRQSPLRVELAPALAPLNKAIDDCLDLDDKERQRLSAILTLLPRSICEEYDHISNEIERIREKHEHIEAIIRLQMRYARLLGAAEEIDINKLIHDALNMLSESIAKRNIQIELHLDDLPPVHLEKAKLIQVIVNIIKNSYEAIDQYPKQEKKIIIKSTLTDQENPAILLTISDNGCGFTSAEHDNLFTFGYSNKKRGTGFGLHSCANYLIANHGSITANSAGPSQGAEFILAIPLK